MDRDHLNRLIDDPARVQRDDIADLKAMAERYPWFSGAHLLLAVGGHREGDVLFDEQLRASAAHLPSRAVLFDRLHTARPIEPAPLVPAAPAPVVAQSLVIVPEPEPLQHEGSVRYGAIEEAPSPVPEVAASIPVEVAPSAPAEDLAPAQPVLTVVQLPPTEPVTAPVPEPGAAIPELPKEEAIAPAPPEPLEPEHPRTPWKERMLLDDRDEAELDRQMRDSAVAISYELLLEREGLLDPAPTSQKISDAHPPLVPTPVAPPVPESPVAPESPRPAPIRARSFTDWLSEETPPAKAPARSAMARPVEDPEIIRAVQQLPPIEPKHAPETAETKALVERFIQQNAQQSTAPKKAEFFNPQTAAKRSLEEHADLVTETLAKIYEKQGNIAKAIAAYERLAVKHPEKSAYFRALAKTLSGR